MRHTNTITGAAAARVCLPGGRVKTCGEEKGELDVSISVTSTAISVSTHRGLVTGHVRRRGMRNRRLPVLEDSFVLRRRRRLLCGTAAAAAARTGSWTSLFGLVISNRLCRDLGDVCVPFLRKFVWVSAAFESGGGGGDVAAVAVWRAAADVGPSSSGIMTTRQGVCVATSDGEGSIGVGHSGSAWACHDGGSGGGLLSPSPNCNSGSGEHTSWVGSAWACHDGGGGGGLLLASPNSNSGSGEHKSWVGSARGCDVGGGRGGPDNAAFNSASRSSGISIASSGGGAPDEPGSESTIIITAASRSKEVSLPATTGSLPTS